MRLAASGMVVLTTLTASASGAETSFEGRNGRIVFASNRAENLNPQIYATSLASGAQRNLTRSPQTVTTTPVASPDGRTILFLAVPQETSIWAMDASGRNKRELATGRSPAFSPDGRWIAYEETPRNIAVMASDGTRGRRVAQSGALPAWSPDGRMIAFWKFPRDNRFSPELALVGRDGSGERVLAPGVVHAGVTTDPPAFSPDGSTIAFVGTTEREIRSDRRADVYRIALRGDSPVRLTDDDAEESSPSFARDGRTIVVARLLAGAERSQIASVRVDASGVVPLTDSAGAYDSDPAFSPDGRWLAFVRGNAPRAGNTVWLVRSDGGGSRRLVEERPHSMFIAYDRPSWMPNGRTLLYAVGRSKDSDLFSVEPNGRNLRQVTASPLEEREPAVSPDGQTIAYAVGSEGQRRIALRRLDGRGEVRVLPAVGFESFSPAWSSDGSRLAFVSQFQGARVLYVANIDGTGLRFLPTFGHDPSSPAWSSDGRIGFLDRRGPGSELWVTSVGDEQPRRLLTLPSGQLLQHFDWSPDGRRLALVRGRSCGRGGCARTEVVVADAAGRLGPSMLSNVSSSVAWSPDGAWLVTTTHVSERVGSRLTLVRARGGAGSRLRAGGARVGNDFDSDWQSLRRSSR